MTTHLRAYCEPFRQVITAPQLKALLQEANPLSKAEHLRFYCPESACQAPLDFILPSGHFFLKDTGRHSQECPHFWTPSLTQEYRS